MYKKKTFKINVKHQEMFENLLMKHILDILLLNEIPRDQRRKKVEHYETNGKVFLEKLLSAEKADWLYCSVIFLR